MGNAILQGAEPVAIGLPGLHASCAMIKRATAERAATNLRQEEYLVLLFYPHAPRHDYSRLVFILPCQ